MSFIGRKKQIPANRSDQRHTHRQGVYILLDEKNKVAHVGRTLRGKNGLRQRLNNHLRGQSSFVRNYLEGQREIIRAKYPYRYLIIENDRERALVEALGIGKLCPKHLGLGRKPKQPSKSPKP